MVVTVPFRVLTGIGCLIEATDLYYTCYYYEFGGNCKFVRIIDL